ncbi:MAG: dihydroorotate dehydrogenase electron transfer subunit [Treponema sp.]|jgi:NAD(P)H-flavin reductase|nr:dihydroorotate dehydrogenase electron transfer subunit [Treponema sp.]
MGSQKQVLVCGLTTNTVINKEIFRLDFAWSGPAPRAGQFFLIKPERTSIFLGRPVSVFAWNGQRLSFLIARRGRGTEELAMMYAGERAELTGPLGNCWADFAPPDLLTQGCGSAETEAWAEGRPDDRAPAPGGAAKKTAEKPVALAGGGIGIAPLAAFAAELKRGSFDCYAGFRTGLKDEEEDLLGPALVNAAESIIAAEDGCGGLKGRITGFLDAAKYRAIYACGPEPMLKAAAAICRKAEIPCFIGMERRMACGTGACLGCTVKTAGGGRRCCTDGPIFPAEEIYFDT